MPTDNEVIAYLAEMKAHFDPDSDEYANISQVIYYIELNKD